MSANEKRLVDVFHLSLGLDYNVINDDLKYDGHPKWDSIAHMGLVADIEQEFGIDFTMEDITSLSSFKAAKAILEEHGVKIEE